MQELHLILQKKGGVGKSVTARILSEYLIDRDGQIQAFDADNYNNSFVSVSAFNAIALDLSDPENPDEINTRIFDDIVEKTLEFDGPTIMDVGSGSYGPLVGYADTNGAFEAIADEDVQVYIHTIITGGEARAETVESFNDLATRFGDTVKIVVWLNNIHGQVVEKGMPPFEEWKAIKRHWNVVHGIVSYPVMKKDTFLVDFRTLMKDNISFNEALGPDKKGKYGLMASSRLRKLKQHFNAELDLMFAPQKEEIDG